MNIKFYNSVLSPERNLKIFTENNYDVNVR